MARYWSDGYILVDAITAFVAGQIKEIEMIGQTENENVDEYFKGQMDAYNNVLAMAELLKKNWGKRKEDGMEIADGDAPFGIALRTANEIINQCADRAEDLKCIKNPSDYVRGAIDAYETIDDYGKLAHKKYDRAFSAYDEEEEA